MLHLNPIKKATPTGWLDFIAPPTAQLSNQNLENLRNLHLLGLKLKEYLTKP